MTRPTFTPATWNDAGLLREYIAARFGQGFEYGMSIDRYSRGRRLARRLATLINSDVETVIATARADAEILFA